MDEIDLLDFLDEFDQGVLDPDEIVTGFQDLIDKGLDKDLEGPYKAKLDELLATHLCVPRKEGVLHA